MMNQSSPAARPVRKPHDLRCSLLLFAAVSAASGCAALMGEGAYRSPQFAAGNAPEPTVVTTPLGCIASKLPPGSGRSFAASVAAIARSQIPAAPVPLSPNAETVMCKTFASGDNFPGHFDWNSPPSLAAVIREIAEAHGAKSIAIPAFRVYARCEQDKKTVRDSTGATVATIESNTVTCTEDRIKHVGLFIFAADGNMLYKSTKSPGIRSTRDDSEELIPQAFANIPATFTAASAATESPSGQTSMATSPSAMPAGPAPAAASASQGTGLDDDKIDGAVADLDGKAPADCKKFIKAVCRSPKIPDASRLQMCTTYVTTVNEVVRKQKSQASAACNSLIQSAVPK